MHDELRPDFINQYFREDTELTLKRITHVFQTIAHRVISEIKFDRNH